MDATAPGACLREHCSPERQADLGSSQLFVPQLGDKPWPAFRIYRPARSVMQAGMRGTKDWVLEFESYRKPWVEPLMGWTASDDPYVQIRLRFPSLEAAVRHAERLGLDHRVRWPARATHRPKSYMETIAGRPSQ
jgi:hypothetical protein